jgi:hypothetical protein
MNMSSHWNRLHEPLILEAELVDGVMALAVTSVVETRLDVQSAGLPAYRGNLGVEEVVVSVVVVVVVKCSSREAVGEVELDVEADN